MSRIESQDCGLADNFSNFLFDHNARSASRAACNKYTPGNIELLIPKKTNNIWREQIKLTINYFFKSANLYGCPSGWNAWNILNGTNISLLTVWISSRNSVGLKTFGLRSFVVDVSSVILCGDSRMFLGLTSRSSRPSQIWQKTSSVAIKKTF